MKIAICDDEKMFRERLERLIDESEAKIYLYESGKDLLDSDTEFDIVLLDIEMPEMSGFEIAKILIERNNRCVFSFVTSHAELAIDGYDYQPYRYILKQTPDMVVKRKLQETIEEYYRRNKVLQILHKGTYSKIFVNQIQWIEINGHCMHIFSNGEIIPWNKALNEVQKELERYGIVRCHRSFMVALSQIKKITANNAVLHSGKEIPIGRYYRKAFENQYKNYMFI